MLVNVTAGREHPWIRIVGTKRRVPRSRSLAREVEGEPLGTEHGCIAMLHHSPSSRLASLQNALRGCSVAASDRSRVALIRRAALALSSRAGGLLIHLLQLTAGAALKPAAKVFPTYSFIPSVAARRARFRRGRGHGAGDLPVAVTGALSAMMTSTSCRTFESRTSLTVLRP